MEFAIGAGAYFGLSGLNKIRTNNEIRRKHRMSYLLSIERVWLTQQQMAELFNTTRNNITLHIGNIFKEGELDVNSVRKESLLTALDGKKYRTKFYNLDVIISVG